MKIIELFGGIGGFSLAAEWVGWEHAAIVEWEPFQQAILKKNFPGTPIFGDVDDFTREKYKQKTGDDGPIDIICGGFPCQPSSTAGRRKGESDPRWKWPAFDRILYHL